MKKTFIERIELDSTQNALVFDDIPQSYADLLLVFSLRATDAGLTDAVDIDLNDTNLTSLRWLRGDGSSVDSLTVNDRIGQVPAAASTANTFSNGQVYIPNYTASVAKSISVDFVGENNATTAFQFLVAPLWNNTSAITKIDLFARDSNFVQYSSASLYGVSSGSDGTTTVS